ncbi:hypothetical protein BX666DRAFT_1877578 [Dichotomocladium elegans]|nr:hypothetical protein BX666DRAFT_1877578 [Dichotomocladium elegans]
MDNNPFRAHNTSTYTGGIPTQYSQQQQYQHHQQPMAPNANSGFLVDTALPNQQQQPINGLSGYYPQQQSFQQQQQLPQPYDPSTAFIPSNFGMSSNTTAGQATYQSPSQPRRPTVDANAYLKKDVKVRREECPICHKIIEGDGPAINHHVNEHLEYDS